MNSWVDWALSLDLFRITSAVMYVIFAVGLFSLGAKYHAAKTHGDNSVGQFPEGYFTMLVIQLFPLLITGFLIYDPYIIGTRLGTLVVVLVVYGMTKSAKGTFKTRAYRLGVAFWLGAAILGPMIWVEADGLRAFVQKWEMWIAWASVAAMILFVIKGQWAVAKSLFRHFLQGNYTLKRFSLQVVRFLGFFFQAIHYWFAPSNATPLFGIDPIFLQGALGVLGVGIVIILSIIGFIRGSGARHAKQHPLQLAPG